MKIAVGQIACSLGDTAANVRRLQECCATARAAGAELIVFPEMSDTGYSMATVRERATAWSEGAVPALRKTARELSLAIISGISEREGTSIYNSQIFIDASGETAGKYRKTHLFGAAPIDEHTCFTAGGALTTITADPFHFGLSICYDLRFPEVYRMLACEQRADVLVNSSAWPFPRIEHLRVLATARAIENQSYVIVANRVGTDAGLTFCGNSAVIDPYGVVIAAASADREEIAFAELSPDVLQNVRSRMRVFKDRRRELYS